MARETENQRSSGPCELKDSSKNEQTVPSASEKLRRSKDWKKGGPSYSGGRFSGVFGLYISSFVED